MAPLARLVAAMHALGAMVPGAARRLDSAAEQAFPIRGLTAAGAAFGSQAPLGNWGQQDVLSKPASGESAASAPSRDMRVGMVKPPVAAAADIFPHTYVPTEVGEAAKQAEDWLVASFDVGGIQVSAMKELDVARFMQLPKEWRDNLEGLKVISRGQSTLVAAGSLRKDPSVGVVVKRVKPRNFDELLALHNELHYLMLLKHNPRVVTMHRSAKSEEMKPGQEIFLLFERAEGNLKDLVLDKSVEEVPLSARIRLFADIAQATYDALIMGCAHGDLSQNGYG